LLGRRPKIVKRPGVKGVASRGRITTRRARAGERERGDCLAGRQHSRNWSKKGPIARRKEKGENSGRGTSLAYAPRKKKKKKKQKGKATTGKKSRNEEGEKVSRYANTELRQKDEKVIAARRQEGKVKGVRSVKIIGEEERSARSVAKCKKAA